jgi:hypothetical protein
MRRTHYGGIGPPGHSDELVRTLRNWLREASNPIGSLPTGTDSVEWALRRFIAWWVAPLRGTIDEIEDCLGLAKEACRAGDTAAAAAEIDSMRQIVGESLRTTSACTLGTNRSTRSRSWDRCGDHTEMLLHNAPTCSRSATGQIAIAAWSAFGVLLPFREASPGNLCHFRS